MGHKALLAGDIVSGPEWAQQYGSQEGSSVMISIRVVFKTLGGLGCRGSWQYFWQVRTFSGKGFCCPSVLFFPHNVKF